LKRHLGVLLTTVGTALLFLAATATAEAEAAAPPPPYEDFAGCPSHAENDTVATCVKYEFTGGHIQLGKKNIPVTNPILFRGGQQKITGEFQGNSEAGIVPVRQTVEGGLIGLTGLEWLDKILSEKEQLKVYAVVESAGQPGSLATFPLSLPVKIHLENPVLGNSCYIGSNENPIQLSLITGTTSPPPPNEPITGQPGSEFEEEAERPRVQTSTGGILVDNSFSAPGANGCQLNLGSLHIGIDNLVNAAAALPAAAGHNTTVLDYTLSIVGPRVAYGE
jgi:hypothetical protein